MDEPPELKVLIADDEPLAAERLQLLLARCDGIDLVGSASDGDSAVRMTEALKPDLLLLDIAMPGLDGIQVARALATQDPSPAVVFVTAFDQFAVAAFEVAANDCRPVQPYEQFRIEPFLQRRHRMMDQPAAPPDVEAHIIAFGRHPVDVARGDSDQAGEIRRPEFVKPL